MWLLFGLRGKTAAPPANRRGSERFPTHAVLRCALGEPTDLSVKGMRLVRQGKPEAKVGQIVPLTLRRQNQQLLVHARVTRVEREGLRKYVIGLQFVNVSPATLKILDALARYGFVAPTGSAPKLKDHRATDAMADLYGVLGLRSGASQESIRAAYRALAVKYHPDHNRDPAAHVKFQEVHSAYVALRETKRRQKEQGKLGAG